MKILLVAEKEGTAIHRLCQMTVRSTPWHEFKIVCVHPKRANLMQVKAFEEGLNWCDLIDFRYWRTAELLYTMYDIVKPAMLTHYNPYDMKRAQWLQYKKNVVVNKEQQAKLRGSIVIPLPVDLDFWTYQSEQRYRMNKPDNVIMVSNRIEGKKGVLEVAQACAKIGLKFVLVGDISDPTYFEKIQAVEGLNMEFHHRIPDEKLRDLYHQASLHVCNSIDNYESGTMPILEAMACGVPVLTRRVGHVPDIFDGRNMIVHTGEPSDVENLVTQIREALAYNNLLLEMRREARFALRRRGLDLYGWEYSKMYHSVYSSDGLVSIVMPISGPPDTWMETAAAALTSNYPNKELILIDDSVDSGPINHATVSVFRSRTGATIKYFSTTTFEFLEGKMVKTYGLARARNKGILEAEGKYIMFVDDKIKIDSQAIRKFVERMKPNTWLWGVKDNFKKGFVENFSMIHRSDIVRIGGFSDWITQYGGMTQEVRRRAELNKINFEMVEEATAIRISKSRSKWTKQKEIAKSKSQCYKLYE